MGPSLRDQAKRLCCAEDIRARDATGVSIVAQIGSFLRSRGRICRCVGVRSFAWFVVFRECGRCALPFGLCETKLSA